MGQRYVNSRSGSVYIVVGFTAEEVDGFFYMLVNVDTGNYYSRATRDINEIFSGCDSDFTLVK